MLHRRRNAGRNGLIGLLLMPALAVAAPSGDGGKPWLLRQVDEVIVAEARAEVALERDGSGWVAHLTASGLLAEQPVRIGAGPPDSEYELFTSSRADRRGVVRMTLPLVPTAQPTVWVLVVADSDGAALAVTEPFRVSDAGAEPVVVVRASDSGAPQS